MQIDRQRSYAPSGGGTGNLADILERVLDKGIVVAGDIRVNLLDIELLTIKLRLLIASADTAREMGIDWWRNDPFLTGDRNGQAGRELGSGKGGAALPERSGGEVGERLDRIEAAVEALVGHVSRERQQGREPDRDTAT